MRKVTVLFALVLAVSLPSWVTSTSVSAATIFSDTFSPQQAGWSFQSPSSDFLGELNNNVNVSSVTLSITASNDDPNASLEFDLLGFRSIDGTNCCTDTLTLTINGAVAFTGAWTYDDTFSTFFSNPSGASFQPAVVGAIGGSGVLHRIIVPHHVLQGANTYTWSYSSMQTFEDEAWGLDNISIIAATLNYRLPFIGGPYNITKAPDCKNHNPPGAVDYALPDSVNIIAAEAGDVIFTGQNPANCYGEQIEIAHPDGRRTRYAHLSQSFVTIGQHVDRGETIAKSGNSTGTLARCKPPEFHLHFEIINQSGQMDVGLISILPGTQWVAGPNANKLCQPGKNAIHGTALGPMLPQ